jgi:hypothetical protein
MKKVGLGLLAIAGLMVAWLGGFGERGNVFAQVPRQNLAPGGGSDLVVVSVPSADKGQLLAVVDTKQQMMLVYRVDAVSGKIALKSARNIHFDLQLNDFNNEPPLPQEIKSMIEQR